MAKNWNLWLTSTLKDKTKGAKFYDWGKNEIESFSNAGYLSFTDEDTRALIENSVPPMFWKGNVIFKKRDVFNRLQKNEQYE